MKKVAILIATLNRLDFLIRTINYYSSLNSPHPIFIGDASIKSSEKVVLEAAKGKVELYYFHWVNLKDRETVKKLAEKALESNISEYCVDQGDDDFYYLNSLSLCAEFLSKNSSYATAQGRAIRFELKQSGPYGDMKDIGVYWDENELEGETALERLRDISDNYWVPNFSVHRTKEFIDDFSVGLESVIDRNFGEFANVYTTSISGKSKFIDCLFLVRQIHDGIDHPKKIDWVLGKNWNSSYNELITSVAKALSKKDDLDYTLSINEVTSVINKTIAIDQTRDLNISFFDFIKTKYSIYLDRKGSSKIVPKIYRLFRYSFLFPSKEFSKSRLLSKKSKYYKDVSLILNACKIDQS